MDLRKLEIDRGAPKRRARRGGRWIGRLIALAVVAALAWLFRAPILAQVDRWRLPEVAVGVVVRASASASAAASGTAANGYVVARRRAALSSDAPGRIVELNVEEGTVVKQGFVVARLYAEELEALLRSAEAELAAGETAVAAADARVGAARTRLEEARAAVAAAEAARDEADATLALAAIELRRAQSLLETGTDTAERLDRASSEHDRAQAGVASAAAELERVRAAVASAEADVAVAQAELEEARARVPGLAALRDQAAATLDKTYVRAPFDGVIVLKDAEVGEVVSPNAQGAQSRGSVATMVDFESLEVQVELPETSLGSVRVGAPAEVFVDAFPGERLAGRVDRVWPTANRQKATIEVRVVLASIDQRLRPDMGVRVVFPAEDAPVAARDGEQIAGLLVPTAALVRVDGREGAFVLERDVARFRPVEARPGTGTRSVVTAGLSEGERVVLEPPPRLEDGDRVIVTGG